MRPMDAEGTMPRPDDPIIIERSTMLEKPGALRGQVWLTIQTRQAQQLLRGRNAALDKPAIIGLLGFADRLRIIWQAAGNDDPYADWWLIKIHEAIDAAGRSIHNGQKALDDVLIQASGMDVTIAGSLQPCRVPLQFANPYAYRGAQLLSAYDTLVCTALTARHVGLLDNETSDSLIRRGARKVRSTFTRPQSYRLTGIDRGNLRRGGGRTHDARQAMGDVPNDVMSGERHALLVPRKAHSPAASVENGELRSASPSRQASTANDENSDG